MRYLGPSIVSVEHAQHKTGSKSLLEFRFGISEKLQPRSKQVSDILASTEEPWSIADPGSMEPYVSFPISPQQLLIRASYHNTPPPEQ
ncbi:hypothetical protein PABG_11697 [Paracoccidioides brasiliensis Pb03]|nr:hypothetical protein PABG_11697 [Paracoccidioides brasiliensis Pb03]